MTVYGKVKPVKDEEKMRVPELPCDVCGDSAIGVASSSLGPFSFGYCKKCLKSHAEPYGFVVATVAMSGGREHVANWVHKVIEGTLDVLSVNIEKFDKDVRKEIADEQNSIV